MSASRRPAGSRSWRNTSIYRSRPTCSEFAQLSKRSTCAKTTASWPCAGGERRSKRSLSPTWRCRRRSQGARSGSRHTGTGSADCSSATLSPAWRLRRLSRLQETPRFLELVFEQLLVGERGPIFRREHLVRQALERVLRHGRVPLGAQDE